MSWERLRYRWGVTKRTRLRRLYHDGESCVLFERGGRMCSLHRDEGGDFVVTLTEGESCRVGHVPHVAPFSHFQARLYEAVWRTL